jgi:5'-nucleotidase
MGLKRAVLPVALVLSSSVAAAGDPFHVMLTNDDGIDSPGLEAVAEVLAADPAYRVTVVAPEEQQSGTGTALVIRGDIAVSDQPSIAGWPAWSVAATPASTARIGISVVLAEDAPQLVLSGINRGENIGRSAWYSGTVGAAREAVLTGVPALACSLELDWSDPRPDYVGAARWLKPIVDAVRDHGLPEGVLLNVNVPREIALIRGFQLARMGLTPPTVASYDLVREENGVQYFRSRWQPPTELEPGSDIRALELGWVAIVPLGLDQTDYPTLSLLQELELAAPASVPAEVTAPDIAAPGR